MTDESLLNALLQELDGPYDNSGLMTIMTTNTKIEEIDDALMRPGRVAHRIKFDEPSEEQAAMYIKKNMGNTLLEWPDETDKFINSIVTKCKDDTKKVFSYAQWNEVVNTAKRFALEREDVLNVTTDDMYNALEFVKGLEILDTEKVGFRKQKTGF